MFICGRRKWSFKDWNSYFKLALANEKHFNVCEAGSASWKLKNSSCFSSSSASLNMNFNPYISILYYQSNFLNYLTPNPVSYPYKMKGVGTAREQNSEHNVLVIREWCHANVDKQRTLLADVDVTPPRGAIRITWHFNVLHREMQAARNVGFI